MSRVNNNAEVAVKPPSSRLNQPGWIQWNEIRIQTQSETEWAAAWKWLEEANSNKRRIPFVVFIAFYYSAELVINVEETLRQRAPTKATGRGPRLKHFFYFFIFTYFFFVYSFKRKFPSYSSASSVSSGLPFTATPPPLPRRTIRRTTRGNHKQLKGNKILSPWGFFSGFFRDSLGIL